MKASAIKVLSNLSYESRVLSFHPSGYSSMSDMLLPHHDKQRGADGAEQLGGVGRH